MAKELDPRVVRFQQIKAANKAKAIARAKEEEKVRPIKDQIRQANPNASDKVVDQILQAHLRAQAYTQRIRGRQVQVVKV